MFFEPEFWVAVAFVILMGLFAYLGVHRTVLQTLDRRSERIKAELDDARRLTAAAPEARAGPEARRPTEQHEAEHKSPNARAEPERNAGEAKATIEDFVARRTK